MDRPNETNCSKDGCDKAAELAVKKVFAILGVDVDRPESVEEFRMDLRFGRRMRRVSDRGILTIVGAVATGLVVAVWSGIGSLISRGGG